MVALEFTAARSRGGKQWRRHRPAFSLHKGTSSEAKAAAVSQRTTEELDKLLARFMDLVQQVQGSEAFQSASSQLQSAAEQTAAQA